MTSTFAERAHCSALGVAGSLVVGLGGCVHRYDSFQGAEVGRVVPLLRAQGKALVLDEVRRARELSVRDQVSVTGPGGRPFEARIGDLAEACSGIDPEHSCQLVAPMRLSRRRIDWRSTLGWSAGGAVLLGAIGAAGYCTVECSTAGKVAMWSTTAALVLGATLTAVLVSRRRVH